MTVEETFEYVLPRAKACFDTEETNLGYNAVSNTMTQEVSGKYDRARDMAEIYNLRRVPMESSYMLYVRISGTNTESCRTSVEIFHAWKADWTVKEVESVKGWSEGRDVACTRPKR